jgi:regulator of CtrA degradation
MTDKTVFVNTLYDESFRLLVEARNYFQYSDTNQKATRSGPPHDRLFVNYQAMRLTSRMTQAMAWLLAQRAVQCGELTPAQACSGKFSLGGEDICTDPEGHIDRRIPQPMRHLLDRSHSLYMRVWRLDQSARERLSAERGRE